MRWKRRRVTPDGDGDGDGRDSNALLRLRLELALQARRRGWPPWVAHGPSWRCSPRRGRIGASCPSCPRPRRRPRPRSGDPTPDADSVACRQPRDQSSLVPRARPQRPHDYPPCHPVRTVLVTRQSRRGSPPTDAHYDPHAGSRRVCPFFHGIAHASSAGRACRFRWRGRAASGPA